MGLFLQADSRVFAVLWGEPATVHYGRQSAVRRTFGAILPPLISTNSEWRTRRKGVRDLHALLKPGSPRSPDPLSGATAGFSPPDLVLCGGYPRLLRNTMELACNKRFRPPVPNPGELSI